MMMALLIAAILVFLIVLSLRVLYHSPMKNTISSQLLKGILGLIIIALISILFIDIILPVEVYGLIGLDMPNFPKLLPVLSLGVLGVVDYLVIAAYNTIIIKSSLPIYMKAGS
jgi:hypothetical protein